MTHLKLDVVSGFTSQAIGKWVKTRLKPGCVHIPRVVGTLKPKDLPELKWINTVLGNLKTTLSGSFHALEYRKYGQTCCRRRGACCGSECGAVP
jgi:hypothetical protein